MNANPTPKYTSAITTKRLMKFVVLAIFLSAFSVARAQMIDVTITGTIAAVQNGFSNNLVGTEYTFSLDINSNTPELFPSPANEGDYESLTGFSQLTFGGNTYSSTIARVTIISNDPEHGYGFILGSNAGSGSDAAQLTGFNSNIAPTVALSNLRQIPLSEFGNQGTLGFIYDEGASLNSPEFGGSIDSFSVSAPEPSTYALLLLGAVVFALASVSNWPDARRR